MDWEVFNGDFFNDEWGSTEEPWFIWKEIQSLHGNFLQGIEWL